MSVSQITKQLQCSVKFFLEFCIFQDLFTGRVKGIGRLTGGLYILPDLNNTDDNKEPKLMAVDVSNIAEDLLWHRRLGHPSINVLRKMSLAMAG
ncbi:MAG: GAG-pre-integrase domain-containing protein [Candidatus Phytoplasma australasiaticum]|nr:GAG-pre-integrase domain-containing protein [Candidatus Phytoplasma australasiaticum]